MDNNQCLMLYKYITKGDMERLLEKKSLSFTRLDIWEDVYEGIMLQVIMPNPRFSSDEKRRVAAIIPKIIYAQSWTYRSEESYAMWKIFSKASGARICVCTSCIYELVKKSIPDSFDMIEPGIVEYDEMTPVYDTDRGNIRSALLHKSRAYDYELEYRFGIYNSSQWEKIKRILDEIDVDRRSGLLQEIEHEVSLNEKFLYYKLANDTVREIMLRYDDSVDALKEIEGKCEKIDLNVRTFSISNLHDKGLDF